MHLDWVRKGEPLRYTLYTALVSVRKGQNVAGAQEVWGHIGVIPAALGRTRGSSTKAVKVGSFQLWPYSSPDCSLHSHEPKVPPELRRTLGSSTKKPCMSPQPFVSLGVASNLCLKQTSAQRQNKNVYPINYSIYQILSNGFQASISVMLYCTWGAPLI